jgi:hypothetical protein
MNERLAGYLSQSKIDNDIHGLIDTFKCLDTDLILENIHRANSNNEILSMEVEQLLIEKSKKEQDHILLTRDHLVEDYSHKYLSSRKKDMRRMNSDIYFTKEVD